MKYNLKNFLFTGLVALSFASCVDDEVNYSESKKIDLSIANVTATSIAEGQKLTVTVNSSRISREKIEFKLELKSGTGSNADYFVSNPSGEDVGATTDADGYGDHGYLLAIPANADTVSFDITAKEDLDVEATEDLVMTLRTSGNAIGVINEDFTFSIENDATDNFAAILEWEGSASYEYLNGDILNGIPQKSVKTESLCSMMDLDLLVFSPATYIAGTSNCPEVNLNGPVLPDGTWLVAVDLWATDFDETPLTEFAVPYKLTFGKKGTFITTVNYDSQYTSTHGTSSTSANSGLELAARIVVLNGKYTVYDANDNLIATE